VSKRLYGQYCGFARALELVGERWALMIVRDLLVEPKRFSALHRGLPGIPTNVLTTRLKELEEAGIVERALQPRPSSGVAYQLTADGLELKDAVYALGRWGAKRLGEPRQNEIVTPDSLTIALRATFQPKAAKGKNLSFELRFGPTVLHAIVKNGSIDAAPGPLPDADVILEPGPTLRALLAHEMTGREALKSGAVIVRGPKDALDRVMEFFRI